jgi:tRNA nucleotidyltransferase (CCA-adding enzyme)
MPRLRTLKSAFEACRSYSTFAARRTLQSPFHPPLHTFQATWRLSMRNPESDSDFSERATKRRRISTSPRRGRCTEAMDQSHPAIQLTPIESTLRTLLLDVAQYIYEKDQKDNLSDRSKTVLRFTGGWVRDKLLGVDSHDIDVGISNMTGYQFGNLLKEYLDQSKNLEKYKQALPDGQQDAIVSLHKIEANPEKSKHLETVTTRIFGMDIDLVNLRKETYTEESRNPQMEFGTALEDALRRDATINALFYNLNESRLEDFTERGLDDMKKKIIRTPMEPYQTFKDDPLRVLRLIRFASRLGYQIESETETAMQNEDIGIALKLKISKERVWAELDKMLRGEFFSKRL